MTASDLVVISALSSLTAVFTFLLGVSSSKRKRRSRES